MRDSLPSGTVTFLFTDIEGSTRLLHELGDRYADVLAEHRRILRDACASHGGIEFGTEGDALFLAFGEPADAVSAAIAGQAGLEATRIRVRMGVHTGAPLVVEDDYVGIDVHKAARICAAGHGGQILLSSATRDMLDGDIGLQLLGEHRLKDIPEPMRLYQVGSDPFPPLRSLRSTGLPIPQTSLVGRENEVAEVVDLLRQGNLRLLTLTGPGGTGKTRVAVAAGAELIGAYEDGVFFVALAGLDDPDLVVRAIAQAVGARDDLVAELGGKRVLLVLDNFEHLLGAAPAIADLLSALPRLNVLATSRAPLHLQGERERAVPSLSLDEAVRLFSERAHKAEPPEAVAEICRRLDYLPLAIELAGARTRTISPAKLLERLDRYLPLLTGGPRDAPERQRTLRATIDWSHELLDIDEQRLFRRVSVFAGGWALEAGEAVADAQLDALESLIDKSLVRVGVERYWMLETIRQYGFEQLAAAGEADELQDRHARYFLDFAKERSHAPSLRELDEIEADLDNVRRARDRLRETGDIERELELARALVAYSDARGHWAEARTAAESAVERGRAASPAARASGWQAVAYIAFGSGDFARAKEAARQSLDLYQKVGDEHGAIEALNFLGLVSAEEGDYTRAAELATKTRGLCRRTGAEAHLAGATANLGLYALLRGDTTEARTHTSEALAAFRSLGHERSIGFVLENLGIIDLFEGRPDDAAEHLRESLIRSRALGSPTGVVNALIGLANVELERGNALQAARILGAADTLREASGAGQLEALEAGLLRDARTRIVAERGEEALATAWREGRLLTADEAVALALERPVRSP
jgi:predicted ATPase/class 3 adenylate cyclase